MNLHQIGFVMLLCFTFQTNANPCTINGCQQNSSSDFLVENLTSTARLPSCTVARNYNGLSFSIVLENNVYQSCSWIFARNNFLNSNRNCIDYNGKNEDGLSPFRLENIFTNFAPCANRSINRTNVREITCVMNNGKNYSSIVFGSISYNDWFVSVQCDGKYTEGFHVRVRPCNRTFGQQGNQVFVESNSTDYNATNSFRCNNNGTLLYSNGTLLQDDSTRCLAKAEWKGQENLHCLKAPTVQLEGNYDWVIESKLILQCEYNDGFPTGSKSIFYVNNTVTAILPKGETFKLTVNRTFNKIPVSCQARTPFTQKYNETGRSKEYLLNVLFAPYTQQSECKLNDSEQICKIVFYSNPEATFVSLFFEDKNITNTSDFSLRKTGTPLHLFRLKITENLENSSGIYNLTVRTLLQPYLHHILFTIRPNSTQVSSTDGTAKTVAPATDYTQDTPFLIGISFGGVLAISLFIILIVIIKRKKQKEKDISDYTKQSCEKEVVMNELYVSADILQNENDQKTKSSKKVNSEKKKKVEYTVVNKKKPKNPEDKPQQPGNAKGNEVVYGVVKKPKKKTKKLDESSEKEEKVNELYASTDMLNNKQTKQSTEEPQQTASINKDIEVAYGIVNKPKKKPKASTESSKKEEKINELYVSADMLENKDNEKPENSTKPDTEKKKKAQNKVADKKKAKKTEGSKPSLVEVQQAGNNKDNEVAYGVVNKPKKKQKASAEKNVG